MVGGATRGLTDAPSELGFAAGFDPGLAAGRIESGGSRDTTTDSLGCSNCDSYIGGLPAASPRNEKGFEATKIAQGRDLD